MLGRGLFQDDSPVLGALIQTYSTALELQQFEYGIGRTKLKF